MKKLILFILCVFTINTFTNAQLPSFTVGFGLSSFNSVETKDASSLGLSFTASIERLYLDFSGNMASGKGQQLDFRSSYTYPANKVAVANINLGYIIPMKQVYFAPVLGYGWTSEIYEDPIAFDTHFYGDMVSYVNVGVIIGIRFNDDIGMNFGVGTHEKWKIGLSLIYM